MIFKFIKRSSSDFVLLYTLEVLILRFLVSLMLQNTQHLQCIKGANCQYHPLADHFYPLLSKTVLSFQFIFCLHGHFRLPCLHQYHLFHQWYYHLPFLPITVG